MQCINAPVKSPDICIKITLNLSQYVWDPIKSIEETPSSTIRSNSSISLKQPSDYEVANKNIDKTVLKSETLFNISDVWTLFELLIKRKTFTVLLFVLLLEKITQQHFEYMCF